MVDANLDKLKFSFYIVMRNFTMIEKIGAVHLIKSYGGEGRKYPEVSKIKYLVLLLISMFFRNKKFKSPHFGTKSVPFFFNMQ